MFDGRRPVSRHVQRRPREWGGRGVRWRVGAHVWEGAALKPAGADDVVGKIRLGHGRPAEQRIDLLLPHAVAAQVARVGAAQQGAVLAEAGAVVVAVGARHAEVVVVRHGHQVARQLRAGQRQSVAIISSGQ